MAEEQEATLEPEKVAPAEAEKVRVVVYMTAEGYERAKKWADYCADEGLIEGHPRGNLTAYTNFCYQLADQNLKSYVLKKRGYK